MVFSSIAITDSMFNFGNFLTKNAITFDPKEIERKKNISRRHEISLHKMSKSQEKNQLFFQNIFNKIDIFFKKILIFRKHKVYFQILEVLPVILTTYLPV